MGKRERRLQHEGRLDDWCPPTPAGRTADDVARGLQAYRGKGLTHLSFGLSTYVPDPVKKRRSMEVSAKELLPEVKTW